MSRWIVAAVGIGALVLSGNAVAGAAGRPAAYTISLHPMGGSHVGGTAAVAYNAGKHTTTVTLHLHGLAAGIHFAHIHVGRCGGNGGIEYALAPMQATRAGTATGVTVLPTRLSASALHINVHGVPSQALKIVACGNL